MIRFGVIVSVVVAAVGLLIVGAVAGELTLVYGSIGLAALALLLLIVGVAVWREDVFSGSGRRGERNLARVGAVAQTGWPGGTGRAEDWRERPAAAPAAPPAAGPGLAADAREFRAPIGALPERDRPADRYARSAELRLAEQQRPDQQPRPAKQQRPAQQLRPAEPAGRPGREPEHRERYGRDAPLRETPPAERSGREAAADRDAREAASARRPDRVERYPTVAGPDRFEPADDPTRLAHRLESLADLGRLVGPDARPAGPVPPSNRAAAPVPAAPVPAAQVAAAPAPAIAPPSPGSAAPDPAGAVADVAARGPEAPPESGRGRAKFGKTRTDRAVPSDSGTPPARPDAPPAAEVAGPAANEPGDTTAVAPASPVPAGTATTDGGPDAAPALGPDDEVLVVPGIARYHKAGCILIRFLGDDDLERTPRRDAEAAGCAPCRACRPDQPSEAS